MPRALTEHKLSGFKGEWRGAGPFYEVWYGKVDLPEERALWFRYKILDGAVQEASCWAVVFDGEELHAGRNRWWLDEVRPPGPVASDDLPSTLGPPLRFQERHAVFRAGDAHFDDGNALGTAGNIRWDLHWRDSGRRFCFIPPLLSHLGIAKSRYDNYFADLRVGGKVWWGDQCLEVRNATGMVGHIRGTKIAGHSWAWAHCNHFDCGTDAVFEGLSARAMVAGGGTPLMTGLFLIIDDQQYRFHGPIQAFRTTSRYDRRRWEFSAQKGPVSLRGIASVDSQLAWVRYIDTDGSDVWCANTKLGNLRLHLTDQRRSTERTLRATGRAAYETVTRDAPPVDVLI